jgi:phi13 family phage major tail protein
MLVGFERLRIGIYNSFDDETIEPENIYTVLAKSGGPQGLNIQNLNYGTTPQYGGDQVVRIAGKGTGAVTAALTALNLPFDLVNKITGAKKINGIYQLTKDTVAPYCSIEAMSHDADGKQAFLALVKGQFGYPDRNPQTNQAQETDSTDALTFTAVTRLSDSLVYSEGYEADSEFSLTNWQGLVFPGTTAVTIPVEGVFLDKTTASVAVGSTVQLAATVLPSNATDKAITWTSSDTNKATVDATGKVTGKAAGAVTITAISHADGTKKAIANVTVTA